MQSLWLVPLSTLKAENLAVLFQTQWVLVKYLLMLIFASLHAVFY